MAVRPVEPDDHDALCGVLARAFEEDPIQRWAFPEPRLRDRYGDAFFRWSLWRCADQSVSWTTDDRAGAALWTLPDRWAVSAGQLLKLTRLTGGGLRWRAPLVAWGLGAVERRHPRDRHLYLAVLGVDPVRQGAGIGSALLAPGLRLCDEEMMAAYLETGKEQNLGFYGRYGFAVVGDLRLPAGPRVWLMRREPH